MAFARLLYNLPVSGIVRE